MVCSVEQFPYNTASFGRGVCTIVYGAEHNLVSSTGVDGVHIMHKCLHRLVHPLGCTVYCMLFDPVNPPQRHSNLFAFIILAVKIPYYIVIYLCIIQLRIILPGQFLQNLHLLYITAPYKRGKVIVKCRYGLSAVHLILCSFHRDTAQDTGCLYPLCRTALPVSGSEPVFKDLVYRVLHTGKALGRIVVFVVDVYIVPGNRLFYIIREKIVIHKRFGGLAGELHHHSRRGVCIHIGILAGNII